MTVGAVRFSTADGRDAWRPLDDREGALRCAARVEGAVGGAPALLSIPPRAASSPVATPPTPPPARQRSSSEGELGAAFRERGERIERAGRQADGLAGAAGDFRALAAARRRRAEQRRKRWF